MIELRGVQSGDGHSDDPITITLEYRYQIPIGGFIRHKASWSEWKTLPVVDKKGKDLLYVVTIASG